jgi:hypothetical protein
MKEPEREIIAIINGCILDFLSNTSLHIGAPREEALRLATEIRIALLAIPRPEGGERDIEKQEKLTSALWGFAYELQHEPLTTKSGDGTMMNLESLKRAQEVIAAIFGLELQEIQ